MPLPLPLLLLLRVTRLLLLRCVPCGQEQDSVVVPWLTRDVVDSHCRAAAVAVFVVAVAAAVVVAVAAAVVVAVAATVVVAAVAAVAAAVVAGETAVVTTAVLGALLSLIKRLCLLQCEQRWLR